MIIELYVNITFFNRGYIMVYDKHKFKISSPNINQKFIEWLRDNDIKIVDNYTVEKDNEANNNELILYVTDKMASDISSSLLDDDNPDYDNICLINTYNIQFNKKHFNVDDYFELLRILNEECCCQIFACDFKSDVCTVFVQGLKNEIWSGIDEFIRKYDDFTLDDFTVRVVD